MNSIFQRLAQDFTRWHEWFVHASFGRFSIRGWLAGSHLKLSMYSLAVACSLLLIVLIAMLVQYRVFINLRERVALARRLSEGLSASTKTIEDNLNHVLTVISQVIVAPYYAFYIWDDRSERYVLRAASHPYDLFEGVAPSYSGLALPKKEAFLPPSVLEPPPSNDIVSFVKDGEVPLVLLAIGEKLGLVRIGPVRHANGQQRALLREVSSTLSSTLADYRELERDRLAAELKGLSDRAITRVASLAGNTMGSIEILLQAFTGITGGSGGIFLEVDADGIVRVHASEGLQLFVDQWGNSQFSDDTWLTGLLEMDDETVIGRGDPQFYDLPVQITSLDNVGAIIVVPFGENGTLLMLQDESFNELAWRTAGKRQLQFLTDQVSRMTSRIPVQRAFTKGYTRLLCQIADFVDNLNPYTVGYSDMMTHYSLAIGKQLGLSDTELRDLALAARLSNIGVIGMDTSLLLKEGKFNDFEYAIMKRHSEISASMIELVTGNQRAAEYVLYHHERVDGEGYPKRISGSNIPIPAKIIHVVQVFLAKVNGRAWRTPVDFGAALQALRSSVGTALDGTVVDAFEQWWTDQGSRPGTEAGSLGYCYEMCCVPESICEGCLALNNPLRCWDVPDNQCKLHGRECSTCFVKSEFQLRTRRA